MDIESHHGHSDLTDPMVRNNNITINGEIVSSSVTVYEKNVGLSNNNKKVEHFIQLNGSEREIIWGDENDAANGNEGNGLKGMEKPARNKSHVIQEMEEIQNAVNKAEITDNTAGVIIFKDQNGVAPPITIEILKNNNSQLALNAHALPGSKDVARLNQEFRNSVKLKIKAEGEVETEMKPSVGNVAKTTEQVCARSKFEDINLESPKTISFPHASPFQNGSKTEEVFKAEAQPEIQLSKKQLRGVLDRKQDERKKQFESIKEGTKSSSNENKKILALDWDALVGQLQGRELKAVQVLKAYQAKALEATEFCNAVTEFNPRAMEIAEKLDKMDTVKGPLHGVPFCVKDDTNLEGMDSTLGYAKNCFKPAETSAVIVQALMELGGVPFCKTNVPQTLLTYGSDNPVYGTTTSAHNNKLTPGGSSSGTGALVGSGGTMFGTGTDVGGSLRLPAHCNGVASIKPTAGRCSVKGVAAVLPNLVGMTAVSGIIGANPKVVACVIRHLFSQGMLAKLDPVTLPIPWDEELYTSRKSLRIGYFSSMSFFPPVGDTVEVVESAVEALKSQGHQLIPMEIPDGRRVMRCASNFLLADQSRAVKKLFEGEEVAKCAELSSLASKSPMWAMKLFKFLTQRKTLLPWIYSDVLASVLDAGSLSSYELWDNFGESKKIRDEVLEEWKKLDLDCCICPVMPFPAPPLNVPGFLPVGAVYTLLWNVVEFPAGVVKFGKESGKNTDSYETNGDQALKLGQKSCKESIGSPIGVQVVALPFKEELVLRVMEDLDSYATENKLFSK